MAIGSAHYEPNFNKYEGDFPGLLNVVAADTSAKEITRVLKGMGAKYGQTLLLSKTNFITRERVFAAIKDVASHIKKDKAVNPLLIFYFCGHGLSEGLGWNLLMMPGNFVYDYSKRNILELSDKSMGASEVWDAIHLPMPTIPFMMLLDCCYEGQDQLPEVRRLKDMQIGFEKQMALTADAMKIVRAMNEFREENCVIFSASPGELAKVVEHPNGSKSGMMGPLGTRFLLAAETKDSIS